ncbi:hypothetical protein [Roseinatronobacter sp. NSM]
MAKTWINDLPCAADSQIARVGFWLIWVLFGSAAAGLMLSFTTM